MQRAGRRKLLPVSTVVKTTPLSDNDFSVLEEWSSQVRICLVEGVSRYSSKQDTLFSSMYNWCAVVVRDEQVADLTVLGGALRAVVGDRWWEFRPMEKGGNTGVSDDSLLDDF